MGTPPTFVAEYETAFNSNGTPKTTSVTVAAGDYLVVVGMSEDAAYTLSTPTGGGLTYTLQQSVVVTDYCTAYIWTAPAPTSQSFTLSVSMSGSSGWWGANCLRFSGGTGIGASSKTNIASGAPSLGLTTTADNSTIVCASSDWTAADGSSRTWRTVNGFTPAAGGTGEATYFRDGTHYAAYAAYWPDAGTAGSKTVGVSSPSGQKYSIIAVEVLGTSSSIVDGTATVAGAGVVTAAATIRHAGAATVAGAGAVTSAAVQRAGATVTGSGAAAAAAVQRAAAAVAGVGTTAATVRQQSSATVTGAGATSASVVQAAGATVAGIGATTAASGGSVSGTATVSGAGSVTAASVVIQPGSASVTGAGSVLAAVVQAATAAAAGAGTVSASSGGVAAGTAAVTGTGSTSAAGHIAGSASLTGAGAVTALVRLQGTAALAGAGTVTATSAGLIVNGTAAAAGQGFVTAAAGSRITPRPFTGTTTRPGSGITSRPYTGITARP
jgi:fibronectin-binding autotransporter adhesin